MVGSHGAGLPVGPFPQQGLCMGRGSTGSLRPAGHQSQRVVTSGSQGTQHPIRSVETAAKSGPGCWPGSYSLQGTQTQTSQGLRSVVIGAGAGRGLVLTQKGFVMTRSFKERLRGWPEFLHILFCSHHSFLSSLDFSETCVRTIDIVLQSPECSFIYFQSFLSSRWIRFY